VEASMSNFSLINNISSRSSQTRLQSTSNQLNQTLQRLSSGLRINRSGDDAAGLAIANSFRNDITTLNQGIRNANDGVSLLQTIDTGLNTISGLLDRATTLATQSATDTFVGNRDTLQQELSKVFAEIDRQAQSIGLGGATGTQEGRFNRAIDVFIGGGSSATAANNQVTADLSDSRVDRVGLNLDGLNIGASVGNVTGDQDIRGGLTAPETLTFTTFGPNGPTPTVISFVANATADTVLNTINGNEALQSAGVKAELTSEGFLRITSPGIFSVSSNTASAANQTGLSGATANTNRVSSAAFTFEGVAAGTAASELSFVTAAGLPAINQQVTGSATGGNVVASINGNVDLRAAGIFAVNTSAGGTGADVRIVSLKAFQINVPDANTFATATAGTIDVDAPAANGVAGGASGARAALEAIKEAVASLGLVQGTVGSAQNNLAQAIDLATAQVTSFQASESTIRDADIASEASNLARLTTLQQAGVAALAQANQSSQALLSLLR
jgi:flagellin